MRINQCDPNQIAQLIFSDHRQTNIVEMQNGDIYNETNETCK